MKKIIALNPGWVSITRTYPWMIRRGALALRRTSCLALAAMCLAAISPALSAETAVLEIDANPLHKVDQRLFGQFMERPFGNEKGERGPEGVVDEKGNLPPAVLQSLKEMAIPLVRFPACTDADWTDWTYLIDNAPGRSTPERVPVSGKQGNLVPAHFGWHEYERVAKPMGWETIAVVNLLDALARRKPLAEAARHAAGMVAYLNAPVGFPLPEGMPDWPALRARNGHPAPFGVRYIQIGNEWYIGHFREAVSKGTGGLAGAELAAWYLEVLHAYLKAIREVDSKVEIIIDVEMGDDLEKRVLGDPVLRKEVHWAAIHTYAPGPTAKWPERAKVGVPLQEVTVEEFWRSWTASPGVLDEAGQNQGLGAERVAFPRSLGYRIAVTEWNWAGWEFNQLPKAAAASWHHAAGIGAAQFLQGLIRQGDAIGLATQSMLLGTGWSFAALKVEPDGRVLRSPQGQMTAFYAAHHGESLLPARLTGVKIAPLPFKVGWASEKPAVAQIDALATGNNQRVVAHLVNRDGNTGASLRIHEPIKAGSVIIHRLRPCGIDHPTDCWFTEDAVPGKVTDGWCEIEVPAASVIAVEFLAGK